MTDDDERWAELDSRIEDIAGNLEIYDRTGKPISFAKYLALSSDPDYKIVARTQVGDSEVVTAWMGLTQHTDEQGVEYIFGTITHSGDKFDDASSSSAPPKVTRYRSMQARSRNCVPSWIRSRGPR